MISELNAIGYCKESIENIEGYAEAVSDNSRTWVCHHRNEIILGMSAEELIRKHLYYERPASELIFMPPDEHTRIHNMHLTEERRNAQKEGCLHRIMTDEHREAVSASLKKKYAEGMVPWNKGIKTGKGTPHTEETKKHLSEKAKERWAKIKEKNVL